MKETAFAFIDEKKDEIINLWQELVNMESGSYYVEGVDKVVDRVLQILADAGAKTKAIEFEAAGNMAYAEFAGADKAPVMLLGHVDTVFAEGEVAKRPFKIEAGKAYGPGVLDMKGGVIAAMYAAIALKHAGFNERPVKLLFAGDEENGHLNSNAAEVFQQEAKGCVAAFDCETSAGDNVVVVGRKGMVTFTVGVHGVSAHAGNDPENGRSAILEMAYKIIDIQNLTNWERGYTFNVGTIKGGTVPNAVPEYCEINVDIRYVDPADLPELKAMVEQTIGKTYIEGTKTELVKFLVGYQPMQTTEGVKKLFALFAEVSEGNGFGTPTAITSGGGSDASNTVIAGVPTLCATGVKGGRNHSPEEFAHVESIFERAKLLAATILRLEEL